MSLVSILLRHYVIKLQDPLERAGGYGFRGARGRDRRERPESFSFHRARRGARARGRAGGAAPGARGAGRLFPI